MVAQENQKNRLYIFHNYKNYSNDKNFGILMFLISQSKNSELNIINKSFSLERFLIF